MVFRARGVPWRAGGRQARKEHGDFIGMDNVTSKCLGHLPHDLGAAYLPPPPVDGKFGVLLYTGVTGGGGIKPGGYIAAESPPPAAIAVGQPFVSAIYKMFIRWTSMDLTSGVSDRLQEASPRRKFTWCFYLPARSFIPLAFRAKARRSAWASYTSSVGRSGGRRDYQASTDGCGSPPVMCGPLPGEFVVASRFLIRSSNGYDATHVLVIKEHNLIINVNVNVNAHGNVQIHQVLVDDMIVVDNGYVRDGPVSITGGAPMLLTIPKLEDGGGIFSFNNVVCTLPLYIFLTTFACMHNRNLVLVGLLAELLYDRFAFVLIIVMKRHTKLMAKNSWSTMTAMIDTVLSAMSTVAFLVLPVVTYLLFFRSKTEHHKLYAQYSIPEIQKKACLQFKDMLMEKAKVDPFREGCMVTGVVMLVYHKSHIKENTIGIIPNGGYRCAVQQSHFAVQWLCWEAHRRSISILHVGNGCEKYVLGRRVDGVVKSGDTTNIFLFWGCYWHGCRLCYPDRTNPIKNSHHETIYTCYEENIACVEKFNNAGYTVVDMWECTFNAMKRTDKDLKPFVLQHEVYSKEPLSPRDAFFGGCTNCIKLFHEADLSCGDTIKFLDVCPLYHYICKYKNYSIGHPKFAWNQIVLL
uniref:Uncharacterized protein n=1 Tax=Timema monikensis TaxID=170555 RepID=A0A7R9EHJ1_9NEOP|nr:unnamed protein product [Timema monikensis]